MNLRKSLFAFVAVCLGSILGISAQAEEPVKKTITQVLNEAKLVDQLDYMIQNSNRYQDYKVVKRVFLDKLKANIGDSISGLKGQISSSKEQIQKQQSTIESLNESLAKTNQNLSSVTTEKDNMQFLGMQVSKGSYKTTMWSIIGVLVALLGFFVYKYRNSNSVTVQARKSLEETEAEFEDHRRRSLEREQKIMRKLQDEINKQKASQK